MSCLEKRKTVENGTKLSNNQEIKEGKEKDTMNFTENSPEIKFLVPKISIKVVEFNKSVKKVQ